MKTRITLLTQFFVLLFAAMPNEALACETSTISPTVNLNASAEFGSVPRAPASWTELSSAAELSAVVNVYDSLGVSHTFRLFFFHSSATYPLLWTVVAYVDGGDVGQTDSVPYELARTTLSFDSEGEIQSPEGSFMDMYFIWVNTTGWQHLIVTFDLLTQLESASVVTAISQDGGIGACAQRGSLDFDGDGADDLGIWRPSLGIWAIRKSSTSGAEVIWIQWGLPGDQPMPGDYTGDRKADLVVWRPSNGNWYVCPSEANFNCSYAAVTQFGLPGDKPLKGDFDGDTVLDPAVWRPNGGLFIYRSSRTEEVVVQQWGLPGDVPLGSSSAE